MSKRKIINKENEDPVTISKKVKLNSQLLIENRASLVEHATVIAPKKMSSKKAIKSFKSLLQNVTSSGEFTVSGEATELPALPNLYLKNFGYISLPLNDSQANDLIKVNIF